MGKMTKSEIQKRHHDILVELDQLDELSKREDRPFTKEEDEKYQALVREDNRLHLEIQGMLDEKQLEQFREMKSKSEQLREVMLRCATKQETFKTELRAATDFNATTVLKDAATYNTNANLEASGAIPLTIHELIDTKVEGLELPEDLRMLTGVIGNEVWPYSIDDVEFQVAGEVEKIDEHALNFAKIQAAPERVAASIAVSRRAIENAAFDLMSFVTYKFQKGLDKFKALHVYSHCNFDNNLKSPFAKVVVKEINLDQNIGKNLAKEVAEMYDLGFEGTPYITMDKVIETELQFTKAIPGQCGDRTVIQDGRCVGYPYTVSKYVNYVLDGSTPKPDTNRYIAIGHYGYLAMEQHGPVDFVVDGQSAEVAKRNSVVLVLNTELSLTELSEKVNGNTSGRPQAFKLLKVIEPASSADLEL